jgi:hypothetical protein
LRWITRVGSPICADRVDHVQLAQREILYLVDHHDREMLLVQASDCRIVENLARMPDQIVVVEPTLGATRLLELDRRRVPRRSEALHHGVVVRRPRLRLSQGQFEEIALVEPDSELC